MVQTDNVTYLGVGLYSVPEAARIIGVNPSTLRNWVKSYTNTVRGRTYYRQPVVVRPFGDDEPALTFIELEELLFVKVFRRAGVPMAVIREAARRGAERLDTPYPFASGKFATDDAHIFATLGEHLGNKIVVEDIIRGQRAFEQIVRPFFHKFDYGDDQLARRFWPRGHEGRVVLDPRRSFGKPIDAETGVPTAVLYDAIVANPEADARTIAAWFAVPVPAVNVAVEYECSLSAA